MAFMSRYQNLAEGCLKLDFRHRGSTLEPLNTLPTTLHADVVETAWTAKYLSGTHREASLMWTDMSSFPSSYGSCWNTFSSLTPSREQALGLASPNNALKSGELWHVWGTQWGQPRTPWWHLSLCAVSVLLYIHIVLYLFPLLWQKDKLLPTICSWIIK